MLHQSLWPLLSDVLEKKIEVTEFSVTSLEIHFIQKKQKISILFKDLNKATLSELIAYYEQNPAISHTYGTSHGEHCASYISSIMSHSAQESWLSYMLVKKWRDANPVGYDECVNFALEKGGAQTISLLLNAAKGTITLNANDMTHQRAISEVLKEGNAQDISLLLNAAKGTITLNANDRTHQRAISEVLEKGSAQAISLLLNAANRAITLNANDSTHQRAISEVLKEGNAQAISLLLNAAKRAITLNANDSTHQRAISEVLRSGSPLHIAMALSSSGTNSHTITAYAQNNKQLPSLHTLPLDRLNQRYKSAFMRFLDNLGAPVQRPSNQALNAAVFFAPTRRAECGVSWSATLFPNQ